MKRIFVVMLALVAVVTGAKAQTSVVNVVEQTGKITQTSTLYAGEVVLDGQQSFYYLYSEDLHNSETVFASVRDRLQDFKGGIYSALVPDIIGETDDKGIAICSNAAYESMMNADWMSAEEAGQACLPSTAVASSSSDNLFDTDAKFAESCSYFLTSNGIDLVDDAGDPLAASGALGILSTSVTDDVTYAVEGGELIKHIDRHYSYTFESVTVIYTKAELVSSMTFDPYTTPLTLEAATDGEITFNYNLSLYHDAELTDIEYQLNDGAWTTYTWNDPIAVSAGNKVAFRGNNASYMGNGKGYDSHITSTADVYVYGNVMSLINSTDFATLTTLTGKDAFSHLFCVPGATTWEVVPNTTIKNHPTKDLVLPATTLTNMCYMNMFAGCQGLTRAPELPATEMTVACYASMFEGCSSLTAAPALPTTTFTPYGFDPVTFEEYGSIDCYMSMFAFCENLMEAPELPATTLVHGVYQNMFQGCTSLERAPVLPAPVVADLAYSYMFDGCTSLNYVKCLATEFEINPDFGNTAEDNVMNWLNNVAATGTFVKAAGMTAWTENSPNGIPAGWTVKNAGEYTVTIPASGVGTFSADENVTIPAGLTAHYCTTYDSDASTISVTAISDGVIPAETGVLLCGTAGETYTLTATAVGGSPINNNALVAVTAPTHVEPTDGEYTNFMLKSGQFIRIAASASTSKMGANKAYLQIPTAMISNGNPVKLMWPEDEATDVQTMDNGQWTARPNGTLDPSRMDNDQWYDLSGRKVSLSPIPSPVGEGRKLPRGIYIHNGKKIVIK